MFLYIFLFYSFPPGGTSKRLAVAAVAEDEAQARRGSSWFTVPPQLTKKKKNFKKPFPRQRHDYVVHSVCTYIRVRCVRCIYAVPSRLRDYENFKDTNSICRYFLTQETRVYPPHKRIYGNKKTQTHTHTRVYTYLFGKDGFGRLDTPRSPRLQRKTEPEKQSERYTTDTFGYR